VNYFQSINWALIIPVETVTLPLNNILVGAMEFALLAFAAVITTGDLLNHDRSVT